MRIWPVRPVRPTRSPPTSPSSRPPASEEAAANAQFEEQYQIFLGLAILLLLLEAAVPDRKKMSEEWTGRFQ